MTDLVQTPADEGWLEHFPSVAGGSKLDKTYPGALALDAQQSNRGVLTFSSTARLSILGQDKQGRLSESSGQEDSESTLTSQTIREATLRLDRAADLERFLVVIDPITSGKTTMTTEDGLEWMIEHAKRGPAVIFSGVHADDRWVVRAETHSYGNISEALARYGIDTGLVRANGN